MGDLKSVDEFKSVRYLTCLEDVLFLRVLLGVEDVVSDRIVEEKRFLLHKTKTGSKGVQIVLFNVNSVDENLTKLRVIESVNKLCDGTLAGP